MRKLLKPAYRLVRTISLAIEQNTRVMPIRVEFFQDSEFPTRFRYLVWAIQSFELPVSYHASTIPHELLTTICLPNLGRGDYFEAESIEAAERRFYSDFETQLAKPIAEK